MAQTIGARIARIARRENGNHACAHGGYFSSCVNNDPHEEWCADFARWVWSQARVLYMDELTPGAGSFGEYGRKHGTGPHKKPRVGDAVIFNYDRGSYAAHVAIVVRVFPGGDIASIGGNEVTDNLQTSYVHRDVYSGETKFSPYWNYTISGYVSPVEDDMPYTQKQILKLVKQGVAAELSAGGTKDEILALVKQGVAAELSAGGTKDEILALVKQGVAAELNAGGTGIDGKLDTLLKRVPEPPPPAPPAADRTGMAPAAAPGADGAAPPA